MAEKSCFSFLTECGNDPERDKALIDWGKRVLYLSKQAREHRCSDEATLRDLLEFATGRSEGENKSVFEVAEEAYQQLTAAREEYFQKMLSIIPSLFL